jgi:hypothetical protein
MRTTRHNKIRTLAAGIGVGALLALPVATVLPAAAGADTTCYTGCTDPTGGSSLPFTNGPTTAASTVTPTSSSSSLPFTGADLGELSVIGVGALGAGAVFLRRSRRRRIA